MSKKALLSLVLIGVMALGLGIGSYAWFTSSATSTDNTFTAGTLSIGVNDGGEGYENTFELVSFDGMLPGDETEVKTIRIMNTGNTNLGYFRQFRMSGSEGLAKQLQITTYTVQDWSGTFDLVAAAQNNPYFDFDNDGVFTLYDIAKRTTEVSNHGWDVLGLMPEDEQVITIGFKLREDAGNGVQGKTAILMYNLKATQINAGAIAHEFGDELIVDLDWLEAELSRQTSRVAE